MSARRTRRGLRILDARVAAYAVQADDLGFHKPGSQNPRKTYGRVEGIGDKRKR